MKFAKWSRLAPTSQSSGLSRLNAGILCTRILGYTFIKTIGRTISCFVFPIPSQALSPLPHWCPTICPSIYSSFSPVSTHPSSLFTRPSLSICYCPVCVSPSCQPGDCPPYRQSPTLSYILSQMDVDIRRPGIQTDLITPDKFH